MDDTIFSKILSGEVSASFVYRDKLVSAFMDVQPVNSGHVLVIPNKPVENLTDLDVETSGYLFIVAKRIAEAIRKTDLKCEGINILLADGEAAGQEVAHVHLHIIPRYKNDGFGLKFAESYHNLPEREELDSVAEKIHQTLNRV